MDELQFADARFEEHWATWSEEKRCQFLYPEHGGINELRRLMRWVAQSDAQLHEAAAIYLEPQTDLIWFLQGRCCGYNEVSTSPFAPFSPSIPMGTRHSVRWQYFLISRFFPLPALEMTNPPLYVQKFDAQLRNRWSVRVALPTAHERLEAALHLKEWARKNDAPAALLALLNP